MFISANRLTYHSLYSLRNQRLTTVSSYCTGRQAFVQSCFVLVETLDEEAIVKAACSNATPLEEEVSPMIMVETKTL